jgi:F0F1-type ATP synthase membrane subunit b/b'
VGGRAGRGGLFLLCLLLEMRQRASKMVDDAKKKKQQLGETAKRKQQQIAG